MTAILNHIRSLEAYVERNGARLVRTSLPECVHGRVFCDLITLRAGLTPEQELLTLVHELAHWLAHRGARPGLSCTVCEYEAEAVEALVMARLGLPRPGLDPADVGRDSPTDGLLSASVARVVWASSRICGALGLEAQRPASEPQASVHFEAATGKEIVLEYKQHGMSDFLGSPEAL
ncbi:MAG: hypothetical protein ACLPZ0_10465 [Steroidobacteraceae bacterium]